MPPAWDRWITGLIAFRCGATLGTLVGNGGLISSRIQKDESKR